MYIYIHTHASKVRYPNRVVCLSTGLYDLQLEPPLGVKMSMPRVATTMLALSLCSSFAQTFHF